MSSRLTSPSELPIATRVTAQGGGLTRALITTTVIGAALYVALTAWAGWADVADRLRSFAWSMGAAAVGLAVANYLLRFARWNMYLSRLRVDVPKGESLLVFLAGFALTVTPGKMGELLKSYLLRESNGIPIAQSAPVIIAERASDLLALLILSLIGLGEIGPSRGVLYICAAIIVSIISVLSSATLGEWAARACARLPYGKTIAPRLVEFHLASRELHRPRTLMAATLLSMSAWACECVAYWVVLRGFTEAAPSLMLCTFIYSTATIAGALSFLPGGLGVQEGGMVTMLVASARNIDRPTALAATFITRLSTLWFAVAVGLLALAWTRHRIGRVALHNLVTVSTAGRT